MSALRNSWLNTANSRCSASRSAEKESFFIAIFAESYYQCFKALRQCTCTPTYPVYPTVSPKLDANDEQLKYLPNS